MADPIAPDMREQRMLGRDRPVHTVEEFVEFLAELEAVFGPDDRPRPPTTGERFLL